MMMTKLMMPKQIRTRITCMVTYVDVDGRTRTVNCDDEMSNEYQISDVDIKNMHLFKDKIFEIKDPDMLVRKIVKIKPLYSNTKETVQLGSVYPYTNILIDFTLSDIRIAIEDGENTNNFKEAYPNSNEFNFLKNLQC